MEMKKYFQKMEFIKRLIIKKNKKSLSIQMDKQYLKFNQEII